MSSAPSHAAQLRYAAPNISTGEDWRSRSMATWVTLARKDEGLPVEHTDDGPAGHPATWCGNVRANGQLLAIHRGVGGGRTRRTPWGVVDGAWKATGEPEERMIAGPSVWAVAL